MARSTRTPEMRARVIEGIRLYGWASYGAAYAGISRSALHEWRKADADMDDACARARDEYAMKLLEEMLGHEQRAPKDIQWTLERLDKATFGRDAQAVEVHTEGPARIVFAGDGEADAEE